MKKYFNKKIILISIILIAIIGGIFLVKNFLRAEGGIPLPNFDIKSEKSGLPNADLIKYFFTKATNGQDIIGARIYKNLEHISPLLWYKNNVPNAGNPSLIKVDGYDGLRDGRSVYVSAGYIKEEYINAEKVLVAPPGAPLQSYLDAYIYLISYNEGATSETQEIFNRMIANWKFNINVVISPEQEQQLRRDIKRWSDINDIKILLENYKATHGYYPKLKAGTYVANHTVSVWPSWQLELAKEAGGFLPVDPINKFESCPGFDALTCWNKETKKYAGRIENGILYPAPNSFVYTYSSLDNGKDYYLGYETEFGKGCNIIMQCFVNNSCAEVGTCHPSIAEQYCQLGKWVNHCGNQTIQCGEQCEIENARNYCDIKYGEQQWNQEKIQRCSNCAWEEMTYSEADCGGYCGDNILQSDYEQCENNFTKPTPTQATDIDHQYECLVCKLTGGYCGDGILQTTHQEQCDDKNDIETDHCNNVCEIINQNPIITLQESQTTRVGTLANITASASDPDGDPLTYLWEIISKPENSASVLSKNNILDTEITPDKEGEYKLKLIVKDNYNGETFKEIKIISQTYCGDEKVQTPGPYHEGIAEECDSQDGLEGYQCIGEGVLQCDQQCKRECTEGGAPAQCGEGTAKLFGEVSDIISSAKISGALMEVKDTRDKLITSTITDAQGKYNFKNLAKSFSQTEILCGYKIFVSKPGYNPGQFDLLDFDQNLEHDFALTPEGLQAKTMIKLTWGTAPLDLDAHLEFEVNNETIDIFYGNQEPDYGASLDKEDKDGNGQEIINFDYFVAGSTYKYYVHNYSGTAAFSSMPVVEIIDKNSNVLYKFSSQSEFAEYWYIFDIDGSTGNITKKNGDYGIVQNDAPYSNSDTPVTPVNIEIPFGLNGVSDPILLSESGAEMLRGRIDWEEVEPQKGQLKFDELDEIIKGAQEAKIQMAYRFNPLSTWGGYQAPPIPNNPMPHYGMPTDMEAWLNFIKAVVERYDGDGKNDMPNLKVPVKYWQITNEWLHQWEGTDDDFFKFLQLTTTAIREVDLQAKIISPAITGEQELAAGCGYLSGSIKTHGDRKQVGEAVIIQPLEIPANEIQNSLKFKKAIERVRALLRESDYFDIVDIHVYADHTTVSGVMRWLKDEIKKECKTSKPIWMLETAGPLYDYSEKEHAMQIVKLQTIAHKEGAQALFWSTLNPLMQYLTNAANFVFLSLVDENGEKKLAFFTYKKMVEILGGSEQNNIQTIQEKDGIYVYKFIKQGKPIWVVWNDNSVEKEITISGITSSSVKITEAIPKYESGEEVIDYNTAFNTEIKSVQNNKIIINLRDKPVFVEE